jgi:hypothetical protein
MTVKRINTRAQLLSLAAHLGVRPDWHEPGERGVTAETHGTVFDNAGNWGAAFHEQRRGPGPHPRAEMYVILRQHGRAVAEVNLATLCAFATGYEEPGEGGRRREPRSAPPTTDELRARVTEAAKRRSAGEGETLLDDSALATFNFLTETEGLTATDILLELSGRVQMVADVDAGDTDGLNHKRARLAQLLEVAAEQAAELGL